MFHHILVDYGCIRVCLPNGCDYGQFINCCLLVRIDQFVIVGKIIITSINIVFRYRDSKESEIF